MATQKFMGRHQLVDRLAAQVGSHSMAVEILKKRGQMDASGNLTAAGRARDAMTAEERAKDRAAKREHVAKSEFTYNPSTNRARRKP